jgi:hypothetical protein
MSQNPDSVINQGEFAGHVAPSEPLMKSGVSINPSIAEYGKDCVAYKFSVSNSRNRLSTLLTNTTSLRPHPPIFNTKLTHI